MKNDKRCVVIGAGLGGLATAIRLAHLGLKVTVIEKQNRVGGRSNIIQEDGYRVDTGPTILVMKETFEELYRFIGRDINSRLSFKQLDPNYRIYFHDNTYIDLFSNMAQLSAEVERVEPGSTERLFQFLGANAEKYELGMPFVDRNYQHLTDLANPIAGWRLFKTRAHESLYNQVAKYFRSDKLRKAFSFHSMFLGLSPFTAPAMYSLITYADIALGMWYPKGGIYSIIEDLSALAGEMNIDIRVGETVKEIKINKGTVTGVALDSGMIIPADLVISNADLPYTYENLLPGSAFSKYSHQRLQRMEYACSGYLLYLGIDRVYPDLKHQALYFSEDYQANLNAIFVDKTLPEDPSFHLNAPTLTDPSLSPPGHTLLYTLAPMPNLDANINWEQAADITRNKLIRKLEHLIDPEIRSHIVWERQFTPNDFETNYNAVKGTAFGSLSHKFFQSAYFRPHNKARNVEGLYFVGQGTYPGIGMPMVLISSKLVVERIIAEIL